MRVTQEFYCNECDGYFRVTLNMELNINVKVHCPNCDHQHCRHIVNGVLFDQHQQLYTNFEELHPQKSSYTKTPIHVHSKKNMRNGMAISDPSRDIINDRYFELYGNKV